MIISRLRGQVSSIEQIGETEQNGSSLKLLNNEIKIRNRYSITRNDSLWICPIWSVALCICPLLLCAATTRQHCRTAGVVEQAIRHQPAGADKSRADEQASRGQGAGLHGPRGAVLGLHWLGSRGDRRPGQCQ